MIKAMSRMTVAALLASAALVGCKKEDPTPTIPAKGEPAPAVTSPKTGATTQPSSVLPTSLPASVGNVLDATKGAVDPSKLTAGMDASAKLEEVTKMIGDKKYDLADAALKKLEDNKASLPEAVQSKLPSVRKSLDAAKMANTATKLPDVPKTSDLPKASDLPNLNK